MEKLNRNGNGITYKWLASGLLGLLVLAGSAVLGHVAQSGAEIAQELRDHAKLAGHPAMEERLRWLKDAIEDVRTEQRAQRATLEAIWERIKLDRDEKK